MPYSFMITVFRSSPSCIQMPCTLFDTASISGKYVLDAFSFQLSDDMCHKVQHTVLAQTALVSPTNCSIAAFGFYTYHSLSSGSIA